MRRIWLVLTLCLVLAGCQKNAAENESGGKDSEAVSEGNSVGEWASDTWNGAVSGGSQAIEGTGEWISALYESARDQGTTTAKSVKEWVADDWNAQGDWQYKIMSIESSDVESLEKTLNEAGSNRWECYHVDTSGPTWTFFMKRTRRSYLARVPLKDLVNMLPVASGDGGSE